MSKMREKESLECVRMHIWALKTQKLPGPLSGPWTPAAYCSLRYVGNFRPLKLGPPLDQILDPHLSYLIVTCLRLCGVWLTHPGCQCEMKDETDVTISIATQKKTSKKSSTRDHFFIIRLHWIHWFRWNKDQSNVCFVNVFVVMVISGGFTNKQICTSGLCR